MDIKGWWYAEEVRSDWERPPIWVIHEGQHVKGGTVFIPVESEELAERIVGAHNAALETLADLTPACRLCGEEGGDCSFVCC